MPLSVQLIAPPISDYGAASGLADLSREVDSLGNENVAFGNGMTVTGATVETSENGPRAYMTVDTGTEGLFLTDPSDTVQAEMIGGDYAGLYVYDGGTLVGGMRGGSSAAFFLCDPSGNLAVTMTPAAGLHFLSNSAGIVIDGPNAQALSITAGIGIAFNPYSGSSNTISWGSNYNAITGAVNQVQVIGGYSTVYTVMQLDGSGGGMTVILGFGGSGQTMQFAGSGLSVSNNGIFTGDVYAHGVKLTSDETAKEEVADLAAGASAPLHSLRPVSFKYRGGSRTALGLVAQDVEKVLPQLVEVHEPLSPVKIPEDNTPSASAIPDAGAALQRDKLLSVDYGGLVILLLAEIQDLHNRVNQLEATHGG